MKIYQLKTSQILPISIENAWKFFSNPANLSKITPYWLNFEVLTELPENMYAGMIITYNVRPVLNIPQTWVTEITHAKEPFYFVDEQRFGPYKMWHHEHIFIPVSETETEVQDIVTYVVPFGILGRLLNRVIINKKIVSIFEYRREVLAKMFGISVNANGKLEFSPVQ